MSLPLAAASGHEILFNANVDPGKSIVESLETNNQAAAATTTEAVRLGEKWLTQQGSFDAPELNSNLDCKNFGAQFVMAGIDGYHISDRVYDIRVLCAPMLAGGTLSSSSKPTAFGNTQEASETSPTGNSFTRRCPSGMAVAGYYGTQVDQQIRGITLMCMTIRPTGRVANPSKGLSSVGGSGTPWPPEMCPDGRPARGLRVATGAGGGAGDLFEFAIQGVQMVCEQPLVPLQITR
jgi:hypothetical protein